MSAPNRATSPPPRRGSAAAADLPLALYRTLPPGGERVQKPRRSSELPPSSPDLDLATRLRVFQRTLRGRIGRRDTFLEIVRLVNATLEPTRIAELVVEQAATWVPAPCWALVCADGSGQLSVLAERGLETEMGLAVFDIAGWVMEHGEEFVTADLQQDSRVHDGSVATVVAFALSCRGRRIGALIGLDRNPSTREPRLAAVVLRSLRVLLEPVAVALDNAVLLKRAEALSVTDDLTSLYNSRYLNQVLRRESKRASRNGRPLSLLFIDLDGFKAVNDAHGHLCGSRTLVEAAVIIRASARETDVVARFGGDEFALILPDTGKEGAFAVGERIRERLADHQFLAGDGLNIRLTASVGVATLPDAANSSEDLMRAADAAMYQVKDRGKNGIRAAGSSR
jgi:diguanylate cyclase (GGDEF)-like protein